MGWRATACPKCQFLAKERWIAERNYNQLNIRYFHVVFTIPDTLNMLVLQNQRKLYPILFRSAWESMQELAANPKYLGGRIGATIVLHTWGQNLCFHPHVHCIVPGGGIGPLGEWKHSREKFFLPIRVLSRLFRGKFLYHLQNANLKCIGKLEDPVKWFRFLQSLYGKDWVAYVKPPFADSSKVINYLGRYTHRVAISNSRITSVRDGEVSFKWKDYKDHGKWKVMTISAHEFIRRFLMHILPYRFIKIRHFGFLANRGKQRRLKLCRQITGSPARLRKKMSTADLIQKLTGVDPRLCPVCGSDCLLRQPILRDTS